MCPDRRFGLVGAPVGIPGGVFGQSGGIIIFVVVGQVEIITCAVTAAGDRAAEGFGHICDLGPAADFGVAHGVIFPVKENRKVDIEGLDDRHAAFGFVDRLFGVGSVAEPIDTDREAGCLGVLDILVEIFVCGALAVSGADHDGTDTGCFYFIEINAFIVLGDIDHMGIFGRSFSRAGGRTEILQKLSAFIELVVIVADWN